MSAVIRIQHIATTDTTVVVQRHRIDVPPGEPHSLVAQDELHGGHAVLIKITPGETITITESIE